MLEIPKHDGYFSRLDEQIQVALKTLGAVDAVVTGEWIEETSTVTITVTQDKFFHSDYLDLTDDREHDADAMELLVKRVIAATLTDTLSKLSPITATPEQLDLFGDKPEEVTEESIITITNN